MNSLSRKIITIDTASLDAIKKYVHSLYDIAKENQWDVSLFRQDKKHGADLEDVLCSLHSKKKKILSCTSVVLDEIMGDDFKFYHMLGLIDVSKAKMQTEHIKILPAYSSLIVRVPTVESYFTQIRNIRNQTIGKIRGPAPSSEILKRARKYSR